MEGICAKKNEGRKKEYIALDGDYWTKSSDSGGRRSRNKTITLSQEQAMQMSKLKKSPTSMKPSPPKKQKVDQSFKLLFQILNSLHLS